MRVAVVSCWEYRDAWDGFFSLFKKFWSDCTHEVHLITDLHTSFQDKRAWTPEWCFVDLVKASSSWCASLVDFTERYPDEPILLMQEDFFLTASVKHDLIDSGLDQLESRNAGMVRLYPCPGSNLDYGDPYYGLVRKGSEYRISCQASIWRPDYLHAIASRFDDPADFETEGTKFAETLPDEVLAFRRDVKSWPMEYLCSGITRGKWNPDSLKLFREHGIDVDTSMREVA